MISFNVVKIYFSYFKFAIFVFSVGNYFVFTYFENFDTSYQKILIIPMIVTAGLVILPVQKIFEINCLGVEEHDIIKGTYNDYYFKFNNHYDRVNPMTKIKGNINYLTRLLNNRIITKDEFSEFLKEVNSHDNDINLMELYYRNNKDLDTKATSQMQKQVLTKLVNKFKGKSKIDSKNNVDSSNEKKNKYDNFIRAQKGIIDIDTHLNNKNNKNQNLNSNDQNDIKLNQENTPLKANNLSQSNIFLVNNNNNTSLNNQKRNVNISDINKKNYSFDAAPLVNNDKLDLLKSLNKVDANTVSQYDYYRLKNLAEKRIIRGNIISVSGLNVKENKSRDTLSTNLDLKNSQNKYDSNDQENKMIREENSVDQDRVSERNADFTRQENVEKRNSIPDDHYVDIILKSKENYNRDNEYEYRSPEDPNLIALNNKNNGVDISNVKRSRKSSTDNI